ANLCYHLSLKKYEQRVLIDEKPLADQALNLLQRKRRFKPSEIHQLLRQLSTESILFMMARATHDDITRALVSYFTSLQHTRTELTGDDLIHMGLEPGPRFKQILDSLLEARLNGELVSKTDEEDYVRRNYAPEILVNK
ncbi:MAG: hypothetical protein HQK55_15050, partial [Deltaproteobacteria bacterium]|nr:hypothetical protein [Deltaproteobacteria bacterium]